MTMREQHILPQDVCYRAVELIRSGQYADVEKLLSHWLDHTDDDVARGLFHSTYGVLERRRENYKEALKHYQRAEKLIPKDPALKLISARLLIQVYHETDQAIRKCREVIQLLPDNPVMVHHAYTLEGLAYVEKGNRRKAIAALEASMEGSFQGFLTCENIDFTLVERCVKKEWGLSSCRLFLARALVAAETHQEPRWIEAMQKIRDAMPVEK